MEAHVALVPGEDVPLIRLSLPDGLRGAVREQVAQRQAADTLGLAAGDLDVRSFLRPGGDWSRVLVAARGQIDDWRGLASGAACSAILPDYLSLPTAPGVWTLVMQEGRLLARLGPEDGFSGDLSIARLQLTTALADEPPRAALWTGPRDPEIEAVFNAAGVPVLDHQGALSALDLPEPTRVDTGGVNLKDLAGAAQARRWARITRWRAPVLLSALAFGLWVAAQWVIIARLDTRALAAQAATTELVRQVFVPSGPLLNIRAQVAARADELLRIDGGSSVAVSPVVLLRRAATPLTLPGLTLRSASYRSELGFELLLEAPDFAALDDLAKALREADLGVEIIGASSNDEGGVLGQLRIRDPS